MAQDDLNGGVRITRDLPRTPGAREARVYDDAGAQSQSTAGFRQA